MPAPETLRAQQARLAAHVRDPDVEAPPPGIEDRRLKIYRDLFYNSLQGLLAANFPVIRTLLGDSAWHALVRDFYRDHRCTTPLFPELPREFIQYLQERDDPGQADPPWLVELAHYEWVELALDLSEASDQATPHDADGDLLAGKPVVSPLAWPLAYTWPVHRLSPGKLPTEPPPTPTLLLVRRGADLRVHFHALSPLTFRLLQRLSEQPGLSGRQQLEALAVEAAAPDHEAFIRQGSHMLDQLRADGVLLGVQPDTEIS
ncbi:DNA-binding domain-containing protein [Arenimonas donghaensis]|uniref:DNA-binding domain-containing protein n=1 Tax=Arenimonas donghaensis DSM 18148 = HO3-R19 TaxID=1121014 RepID=A0A087MF21_9GAMM|nr:putative DNA-binding domain-containing protein [Arenimonas donghaensis]KFL35474.1 hypothetical protein N788_08325 [Arenimonas donghaensis DSM 18148 = HO3-R19]